MIESTLLQNSAMQVRLLNLGCITQSLRLDHWDETRSAVLGYQNSADYRNNPHFMGAVIGRVANRIEGARFVLNGECHRLNANEGPNTLHGGTDTLATRIWDMDTDGDTAVQFRMSSPEGDQGFPAKADFCVTVSLDGNTLTYDLRADVNAPTPINMTQHNYYNLAGEGSLNSHHLTLPSYHTLATRPDGIPTDLFSVTNSDLDFNKGRNLSQNPDGGLDVSYCLDVLDKSLIKLEKDETHLTVETDQDSLQVYTAGKLHQTQTPFGAQTHTPFCGICLEPQGYPNAVNRPDFPTPLVTPDAPYQNRITLTLRDGHTE